MYVFRDAKEIESAVDQELGVSDWLQITQQRIDLFAEATGDHQWIHVGPEKAASGPFEATIAHGYLTLSLIPLLGGQVFRFEGNSARVNYGTNRVRFVAPVRVDSRVRDRVRITGVRDIPRGQQIVFGHTIELKGSDRPACTAETVVLRLTPKES